MFSKQAQKCFCGAATCRGEIGTVKQGNREGEVCEEAETVSKTKKKIFDDLMVSHKVVASVYAASLVDPLCTSRVVLSIFYMVWSMLIFM